MAEMEPRRAAGMRVSDAERHQVAEVLRQAAGEGRIDLGELDERIAAVYAAKTYGDLVPLTSDLPATATQLSPTTAGVGNQVVVAVQGVRSGMGVAIMGGYDRAGDWLVPEKLNVLCLMGGAELDLRTARFSAPEVTITVLAIMGGCEIKVPPGTRVETSGLGIMGGFGRPKTMEVPPGAPVLHVNGLALMGGIDVKYVEPEQK